LLADFAEKKPRPDVAWLGEKRFHHVESKLWLSEASLNQRTLWLW
jgi:hypothetical protein